MNLAEGMRRIGIALTVLYVIAATIFVIGYANEQGRVPAHDIDLMRGGKCYSVGALNKNHAQRLLRDRFHDPAGTKYPLRSGHAFCELENDPYAAISTKTFFDLSTAITETWRIAMVAAILYGMAWGAWQGVRWVLKGFRKP